MQKKQEAQKLLEDEMKTLKSAKPERVEKITQFQIETRKEKEEHEKVKVTQKAAEPEEPEIEENPNRIEVEGAVARSVNEAIQILGYILRFH